MPYKIHRVHAKHKHIFILLKKKKEKTNGLSSTKYGFVGEMKMKTKLGIMMALWKLKNIVIRRSQPMISNKVRK